MYVNPVLLGVLGTLFVEMALPLLAGLIAAFGKDKGKRNQKNNKYGG